jgi:hypothetical protein
MGFLDVVITVAPCTLREHDSARVVVCGIPSQDWCCVWFLLCNFPHFCQCLSACSWFLNWFINIIHIDGMASDLLTSVCNSNQGKHTYFLKILFFFVVKIFNIFSSGLNIYIYLFKFSKYVLTCYHMNVYIMLALPIIDSLIFLTIKWVTQFWLYVFLIYYF